MPATLSVPVTRSPIIGAWFRGVRGIAILYGVAFAVLTAGVGLAMYLATGQALAGQVDARLAGETSTILGPAGILPLPEIARRIAQREGRRSTRGLAYVVIDQAKRPLAGALNVAVASKGYSNVTFQDATEGPDTGRALATALPGGAMLVIVADNEPIEAFDELLVRIFAVAFGAAILAGVAGGAALSAAMRRRLDGINTAAVAIIGGDLTRRMPSKGSHSEFDRLSVTLNRMLDRIAELMASVRQVSSDIAHELRTPLGRLQQRLEAALVDEHEVGGLKRHIDGALIEARTLLDLFAALLRISEIEAGARRAAFVPLDLSELARDVTETFAPAVHDGGRRLVAELDQVPAMTGDRQLLTQLLVNLIENAARHTSLGTAIAVTVEGGDGTIVLRVADNGQGIGDADANGLMGRFVRLAPSGLTAGHGLGLALVSAIVRLHDGRLTLKNNAPGLSVEITFDKRAALSV